MKSDKTSIIHLSSPTAFDARRSAGPCGTLHNDALTLHVISMQCQAPSISLAVSLLECVEFEVPVCLLAGIFVKPQNTMPALLLFQIVWVVCVSILW